MLDTGALNFYCFRFGNTDIIFDEKLVFPLNIYATNVHDKLVCSLVQGKWIQSSSWSRVVDPLNGEPFIKVAEVDKSEIKVHLGALICLCCDISKNFPSFLILYVLPLFVDLDAYGFYPNSQLMFFSWWLPIQPFVDSLSKCPKHGLHNPFKSPERFVLMSLCSPLIDCCCYLYYIIRNLEQCSLRKIPYVSLCYTFLKLPNGQEVVFSGIFSMEIFQQKQLTCFCSLRYSIISSLLILIYCLLLTNKFEMILSTFKLCKYSSISVPGFRFLC